MEPRHMAVQRAAIMLRVASEPRVVGVGVG